MSYLYEMLSIASLGDVDMSATITYTIDGLPGSVQSKNFMYEASTLKDFKTKLKSYEIQQGRRLEPGPTGSSLRCLNCGGKSHEKNDCPHKEKGTRCFKCDVFGHVSSSCPNGTASTSKKINMIQQVEETAVDDEDDDLVKWTTNEINRRSNNFEF